MKSSNQINQKFVKEKLEKILNSSYKFCKHEDAEVSAFAAKVNDLAHKCLKVVGQGNNIDNST